MTTSFLAGCADRAKTLQSANGVHPIYRLPSDRLQSGQRVQLIGLVARADLNGAIGEVLTLGKEQDRVPVKLGLVAPHSFLKVRPINVCPVLVDASFGPLCPRSPCVLTSLSSDLAKCIGANMSLSSSCTFIETCTKARVLLGSWLEHLKTMTPPAALASIQHLSTAPEALSFAKILCTRIAGLDDEETEAWIKAGGRPALYQLAKLSRLDENLLVGAVSALVRLVEAQRFHHDEIDTFAEMREAAFEECPELRSNLSQMPPHLRQRTPPEQCYNSADDRQKRCLYDFIHDHMKFLPDSAAVQASRCELMRVVVTGCETVDDGGRKEMFFNAAAGGQQEDLRIVCRSFTHFAEDATAIDAALRMLHAYIECIKGTGEQDSPKFLCGYANMTDRDLSEPLDRDVRRSDRFHFISFQPGLDSRVCSNHKQVLVSYPVLDRSGVDRGCLKWFVAAMDAQPLLAARACELMGDILDQDDDGFRAGTNGLAVAGCEHPRSAALAAGALPVTLKVLAKACSDEAIFEGFVPLAVHSMNVLLGLMSLHPGHLEGVAAATVEQSCAHVMSSLTLKDLKQLEENVFLVLCMLVRCSSAKLKAMQVGAAWLLLVMVLPNHANYQHCRTVAANMGLPTAILTVLRSSCPAISPTLHRLHTIITTEGKHADPGTVRGTLLSLIAKDGSPEPIPEAVASVRAMPAPNFIGPAHVAPLPGFPGISWDGPF